MRQALREEQFELYYQPKIDCQGGAVEGVEALIRWIHPESGFVPPSEFIPVAERTGLIQSIGSWVLETACRQCAELSAQGFEISVAINISAQQLLVEDFASQVLGVIRENNVPEHLIELEITDSVLLKVGFNWLLFKKHLLLLFKICFFIDRQALKSSPECIKCHFGATQSHPVFTT